MTRRLAVIGMGKMGHAIADLAPQRGWDVVATLDEADTAAGVTSELLNGADVAVEFTTPEAAPRNIRDVINAGCAIVVGTTGWYAQLGDLSRLAAETGSGMLTATNFSLGVNIFEQIVTMAAGLLAHVPGFEAHLIETHHSAKKDAPSGTANTLARAASDAWVSRFPSRACARVRCRERTSSSSMLRSRRSISNTSLATVVCSPRARSSQRVG